MGRKRSRKPQQDEAVALLAARQDVLERLRDTVASELSALELPDGSHLDDDLAKALVLEAIIEWARDQTAHQISQAKQRLTWEEVSEQLNRGVGTVYDLAKTK